MHGFGTQLTVIELHGEDLRAKMTDFGTRFTVLEERLKVVLFMEWKSPVFGVFICAGFNYLGAHW
jgi:hypothetical protein